MEDGKKLKPFNRNEVEALIRNKDWKALREYNLKYTDLRGADFTEARLYGVDFTGAKLVEADLTEARLYGADFTGADLTGADLTGAGLYRADLTGADLTGADLYGADLTGVGIDGVFVDGSTKWYKMRCPEEGEFTGYKKAFARRWVPYIVKLRIPASALRSSATSEKCRCSEAEVVSITDLDGEDAGITTVYSSYNRNFAYTVGEKVKVDDFCMDRWSECAPGIHFFVNRDEAVMY